VWGAVETAGAHSRGGTFFDFHGMSAAKAGLTNFLTFARLKDIALARSLMLLS